MNKIFSFVMALLIASTTATASPQRILVANQIQDYDAQTAILLHLDGVLSDSSIYNYPISAANGTGAYVSGKFGQALDVSSGGYPNTPEVSALQLGSANFTIEEWVNTSAAQTTNPFLAAAALHTVNQDWALHLNNDGSLSFTDDGTHTITSAASAFPADSAWHHVAVVRNGNVLTIYLDGTQVASGAWSTAFGFHSGDFVSFGGLRDSTPSNDNTATLSGKIDEVRLSLGVARWTSNFTPAASAYTNLNMTQFQAADASIALSSLGIAVQESGSGAIVTGANGISVNPDGASIDISANALEIKNGGVTSAKLASGSVGLASATVNGVLPFGNGGTGQSSYTDGQLLIGNSSGGGLSKSTLTAGSGVMITNGNGSITITATGSGGSVTSVALSDGSTSPIFSISGSPVTTSGTLVETLMNQSANSVFAGPTSGGAAQPGFRSLVAADIPALPYANQALSNLTGFTAGQVAFPGSSSTLVGDSNYFWDNTNKRLGIGNSSPITQLYVSGQLPASSVGNVAIASSVDGYYVKGNLLYYVNSGTGVFYILDISNPSSPVIVSSVSVGGSPVGLWSQGQYAYTLDTSGNRIQAIDVTDQKAPVLAGSASTAAGPVDLYVSGRYGYVAAQTANKLQVFDLVNPASPVLLSTTSTVASGSPINVYVSGRYAYMADNGANKLEIFDVGNPSSPSSVGNVTTGSAPRNVWVQGRYAYLVNQGANTLQVIDVNDPTAPSVAGSVATGNVPVSMQVQSRYAYVANAGDNTIQVFDISAPAAPVSVGTFATASGPNTALIQGRYAYIEANNHFYIFDLGGSYIQSLEAGSLKAANLAVSQNLDVNNDLSVKGGFGVGGRSLFNGDVAFSGLIGTDLGASFAVVTDASGNLAASATTSTEIGFVSGVTSSIQTQLNGKMSNALTSAHLFVGNGSNVATDVAVSGDLTLANTGAFTIANNAVTTAKIANGAVDLTSKVTGVLPAANGGASPNLIGAAGSPLLVSSSGISFSSSLYINVAFIEGNAAPTIVTANPAISGCSGSNVGATLQLIAEDNTNTVTFNDGNGLSLNGSWVGALNSALKLLCDGSTWVETDRR